MNRSKSLSSYFDNAEAVTLDNCDREQIHLSGAIQPIGMLLVVDPDSNLIIAASENITDLFNMNISEILNSTLGTISESLANEIAALDDQEQALHEVLDLEFSINDVHYDSVTHFHGNTRIIEFLPNNTASSQGVKRKMRTCSKGCARILQSASFDEGMQIATDTVREITGFNRIKIYQFLTDWSGKTIAESRDEVLDTYKGLHFPATDIPKQVRQIMLTVPYRAIGTVSDDVIPILVADESQQELDLTWSLLRSVSTMHTEYCRNMQVGATFSCSLLHKDSLWGLIACHNRDAQLVPFDDWNLIHEIGVALMMRYDQQERREVSDMIYQLRLIENRFASEVRKNGDVEDVIRLLIPTLQKFLKADGFAFQYGTKLHLSGTTPPDFFVRDLIRWAIAQRDSTDQFQTTKLHSLWAPAKEHMDTACGVLIQPITIHRVCQLIWFRGPVTQQVEWAGDPAKQLQTRPDGSEPIIEPRASFKRWMQEHSDESAPWQEAELESAREIFKEFLDIIASQVLLKQENDSLRSFTASAAHDIRAPLRGISMALEIMGEEDFDVDTVKETHEIAQKSANRLMELTTTLLDLALITEQEHAMEATDLNAVVMSTTELLVQDIAQSNAKLEIDALPTIQANHGLMTRLFLNLISNALKYAHPDRSPMIKISSVMLESNKLEISVADNGLGIAQEKADSIFKPLQRLHSAEKIEGTGLGLTICKKVMDVHNGAIEVDPHYQNGSRFIVTFPCVK